MINGTPDNFEKFPVPVTGTPIPRGWLGRLVAFVNSLVLHGDKQYFAVEHGPNGTTITPTTALTNALSANAGTPPAAPTGIEAAVSGGTATVTLTGGTGSVSFIGAGSVTITGGTNGEVVIGGSGGGGSVYPVWGNLVAQDIVPTWTGDDMDSFVLANSGYLKINAYPTIQLSDANNWSQEIYVYVYVDEKQVYSLQRNIGISSADTITFALTDGQHDSGLVPVCAGSTVSAKYYDSNSASPSLTFTLYKDVSNS